MRKIVMTGWTLFPYQHEGDRIEDENYIKGAIATIRKEDNFIDTGTKYYAVTFDAEQPNGRELHPSLYKNWTMVAEEDCTLVPLKIQLKPESFKAFCALIKVTYSNE